MKRRSLKAQAMMVAGIGLLTGISTGAWADEGMWTYNSLPKAQVQQKYGFRISDAWAAHLEHSSVRFVGIASGSFISADGLIMTNHHVGLGTLQKLSDAAHNYVRDGFYARTRAQEIKAPDLELETLDSIVPVTDQVNAAVLPSMTASQAFLARRTAIAGLEKEAQSATGLRCSVVTLFGGAQYDLYRYKRYPDVRLVMAPEADMAFFGGDPDNFEYPRYDLDMCFFRAYENGHPARISDYLSWNKAGPKEGDLVFVSGHPGRTSRLATAAELGFQRDSLLPAVLNSLRRREVLWTSWGSRLPENARVAHARLFGTQNSRKELQGELQDLQDPALLTQKQAQEQALRSQVAADPKLQAAYGDAWDLDHKAVSAERVEFARYGTLTGGPTLDSSLFSIALTLVQQAEEEQKPNGQRLPEFSDANRASLDLDLLTPAPIYPKFERLNLADSLAFLEETFGADNPLVAQVLAGKSPAARAAELVDGTRLADVIERQQLLQGGLSAVQTSSDPMIKLALGLEPTIRAFRRQREEQIVSVQQKAYADIARSERIVDGDTVYPDATGTLRLSYGTVKGYTQEDQSIPAFTTMADVFGYAAQHGGQPPYQITPAWLAARPKIAPGTPFDFVCTADIIGGNSGSPVVDLSGSVVGLIFDGNIQSLGARFAYSETQARAVAVDSAAILEALRHVYGDSALADEITMGHTP